MIHRIICLLVLVSVDHVQADLDLPEGSPCTVDGVNGTCVTLFKCFSAALSTIYHRSGYYEYIPELPELCSYSENYEPVYCCTDCTLDTNQSLRNSVVFHNAMVQERRQSISWNKCADYFQTLPYPCRGEEIGGKKFIEKFFDKIHKCHKIGISQLCFGGGGRDAERAEFPHMALLGYGADQMSAQWLCGGSVISERFILSAAHCSAEPMLGPLTYAALGILKRSDLKEFWKVYRIKQIIIHPGYQSPSKYHDIALLETETEINFSRSLLPVCLDSSVSDTRYYRVTALGWGRLGQNKDLADTLQVLDLSERSKAECEEMFPPHRLLKKGYDHTTQMCYGAITSSAITDTCEGDSGGPLQVSRHCMFTVFGVTSFGKGCGYLGKAGMYTRVKHYIPWIESVVWPDLFKDYYNNSNKIPHLLYEYNGEIETTSRDWRKIRC